MQPLIIGAVAVLAGVLLGYWLSAMVGRREKAQLERRAQELGAELGASRAEMAKLLAESAARAGFESLAIERERTIRQLATERDLLRVDLQNKGTLESESSARIRGLETELRN